MNWDKGFQCKKTRKHKKNMNASVKPICLLIDAPCKALACSDQRCKPWEVTSELYIFQDHMIPRNDALVNADLVSKNGLRLRHCGRYSSQTTRNGGGAAYEGAESSGDSH